MSFEDDLMDAAEFVELINEEQERALRDTDLTVAEVARIRDDRRRER